MLDKRKVKINTIIESQLPEFLREESPLFKEFLSQYYISQEHKTGTVDVALDIQEYKNIETYTTKTFYTKYNPCTLTANLLPFDDIIQVNSVTGFPDKYGLLKIGDEIITYTELDKVNNKFLGCIRGFSGITSIEDAEDSSSLTFSFSNASEHLQGIEVVNLNILFYEKLFEKYKAQYLPDFEGRDFYQGIELELILSRIKDFYLAKGTDVSYKILFELLYGDKISILKPKDFLIKTSDDRYLTTKNILVERINGTTNPLDLIGYTLYQNLSSGVTASASIYNVEYRPVDGIDLFELSLDSESFIYEFESTKKANIIEITNNTIIVDSTVGFPNSSNVLASSSTLGSYINDSYSDKTVSEFIGFSTSTLSALVENDFILENNLAYCILDDGTQISFRILNVIGTFDYAQTKSINVGDKIALSSFGEDLSNDVRFNQWIYNYPTYHNIKSIERTGNNTRIQFYDSIRFYVNDVINVVGIATVETTSIKEAIDDRTILVGVINNLNDKTKVVKKINKSLANLSFTSYIQNAYLNENTDSAVISTSGLPTYGTIDNFIINDWTYQLTKVGSATTSLLQTDKEHNFLTGNKLYLNSNQVGISTGDYFIRKITQSRIKLYYSVSDLYRDIPILFNDSNVGVCKVLGYENLNKGFATQKILKEFKTNTISTP